MNPLEGWAQLCVLRGDYDQAITLAQKALELAEIHDKQVGQIVSLSCLGHAYVGMQLWAQAQDVYTRAAAVPVPDLPRWSMEHVVGLAYVSWRQGNETAARAHINHFLDLLAHSGIEGSSSPSLSYGRAAEVLRALGEAQLAEEVLARKSCFSEAVELPG